MFYIQGECHSWLFPRRRLFLVKLQKESEASWNSVISKIYEEGGYQIMRNVATTCHFLNRIENTVLFFVVAVALLSFHCNPEGCMQVKLL